MTCSGLNERTVDITCLFRRYALAFGRTTWSSDDWPSTPLARCHGMRGDLRPHVIPVRNAQNIGEERRSAQSRLRISNARQFDIDAI